MTQCRRAGGGLQTCPFLPLRTTLVPLCTLLPEPCSQLNKQECELHRPSSSGPLVLLEREHTPTHFPAGLGAVASDARQGGYGRPVQGSSERKQVPAQEARQAAADGGQGSHPGALDPGRQHGGRHPTPGKLLPLPCFMVAPSRRQGEDRGQADPGSYWGETAHGRVQAPPSKTRRSQMSGTQTARILGPQRVTSRWRAGLRHVLLSRMSRQCTARGCLAHVRQDCHHKRHLSTSEGLEKTSSVFYVTPTLAKSLSPT